MRKGMAVLLGVSCMLLSCVVGQWGGVKAEAKSTIASLDYSYTNLHDTDTEAKYIDPKNPKAVIAGGKLSLDLAEKYGAKDSGYAFTKGNGRVYASLNGQGRRKLEWSGEEDKFQDGDASVYAPVITAGKKNLWDEKNLPYYEVEFSTKGYQAVTFSLSIGATKKAPKSYRMAYRVGNSGKYTTLFYQTAAVTLSKNKQFVRMSAALPDAVNDKERVMVKIYATDAATVGGGKLSDNPTGGKIGINHILVEGAQRGETKSGTQNTTKQNPTDGKTVKVGKATVSKVTVKKKKVTVTIKKMSGVSGYQVQAASDKKIKKNVKSVKGKSRKVVFKKWKRKACYVRVRAYKTDASGKRIYGKWSSVKKAKKVK